MTTAASTPGLSTHPANSPVVLPLTPGSALTHLLGWLRGRRATTDFTSLDWEQPQSAPPIARTGSGLSEVPRFGSRRSALLRLGPGGEFERPYVPCDDGTVAIDPAIGSTIVHGGASVMARVLPATVATGVLLLGAGGAGLGPTEASALAVLRAEHRLARQREAL
ncbi:MAG: hypothetical protein ACK51T_03585, partial [bacterium]